MGKILKERKYFLVDNGSLKPEATINLRIIGNLLQKEASCEVRPMGLMHSHKIDSSLLGGQGGESMEAFFHSDEAARTSEIFVLPFFFGPSRAVTEWLPENLRRWEKLEKNRRFRILDCLYDAGDDRIARALAENSSIVIEKNKMTNPSVALVDHGTPVETVNKMREEIGSQLKSILGDNIDQFSTCCMEKREGKKYDFNDPLLQKLLDDWSRMQVTEVVVAQLFLSPGRHAGKGGDLEQICKDYAGCLKRTELLGTHPLIIEILSDRIRFDKERNK